jgi:hypothetical protein
MLDPFQNPTNNINPDRISAHAAMRGAEVRDGESIEMAFDTPRNLYATDVTLPAVTVHDHNGQREHRCRMAVDRRSAG